MKQKDEIFCPHIKAAREASAEKRYASITYVSVEALANKISDDEAESMLIQHSIEGEIPLYILPGENLTVPNMYEDEAFVHIR